MEDYLKLNDIPDAEFRMDFESSKLYIEKAFLRLREKPFLLASIGEAAFECAIYCLVLENDKDQHLKYLRLAHLATTWYWYGIFEKGPYTLRFPDREPIEIGRIHRNLAVNITNWNLGIDLALIFNDTAALREYHSTPLDYFVAVFEHHKNRYEYRWAAFRVALITNSEKLSDRFHEALDRSKHHHYDPEEHPFILNRVIPLLGVYYFLFGNEHDKFREALKRYLKLRKEYALDQHKTSAIQDCFSSSALAACVYAYHGNIEVGFESDYMPSFLAKGEASKLRWPDPNWIEK